MSLLLFLVLSVADFLSFEKKFVYGFLYNNSGHEICLGIQF